MPSGHVYFILNYVDRYIWVIWHEIAAPLLSLWDWFWSCVVLLLKVSFHCFNFQINISVLLWLLVSVPAIAHLPGIYLSRYFISEHWKHLIELVAMELACIRFSLYPRFNEVEVRGLVFCFHHVRPYARPSVRLWIELCQLCIFHNTSRIQFIFAHPINQVC